MSLLSVTVKKAHYVGPQAAQFNTYVTLKLQNVKSTTVTVKGADPCWEQDFLFETNDVTAGLLVEVWNKGMIWDRAIGYHWLPLQSVHISNEEGCGRWAPLAGELIVRGSEVVGTAGSTGHGLLLDCRFELPFGRQIRVERFWRTDSMLSALPWTLSSPYEDFSPYDHTPSNSYRPYKTGFFSEYDAEGIEAAELQRKLDLLNCLSGQERADQARRQLQYTANSGYSEDSDYTSDLNFPVGQHPNSSASQFRAAAHQLHTPTRSFETSRENSYERDDVMYGGGTGANIMRGAHDDGYGGDNRGAWDQDPEPLYYNSRPRYTQEYTRMEGWRMNQLLGQQSLESDTSFHSAVGPPAGRMRASPSRKPSLERQNTSYDETCDITPTYTTSQPQFSQQTSYEEFFDTSSYPYQSTDEYSLNEDRQWDTGGYYFGRDTSNNDRSSVNTMVEYENHVNKRRSSGIQLPQIPNRPRPHSVISETYGGTPTRRLPRITGRGMGRTTPEVKSRGASLPATPPGTPKFPRQLPRPPAPASLPPAPTTPRMLPRPPTPASQVYDGLKTNYNKPYNEDYNYGYDSLEDQSQTNVIDSTDTTDYIWPRKKLPVVTESFRKLPAPPSFSRSSTVNNYQVEDSTLTTQTYTTPLSYNSNNYISNQETYEIDSYNKTDYSIADTPYSSSLPTYSTIQQNTFKTETTQAAFISSYAPETMSYSQDLNYTSTATTTYANDLNRTIPSQTPFIADEKSYNDTSNYVNQGYSEDQAYIPDEQQPYNDDQYMNESFYSAESQPYVEEHNQYYDQKSYMDTSEDMASYETSTSIANHTADTSSYLYNQQHNNSIIEETGMNDLYKPTEPYYNESEPYYDGQMPYNEDLSSYQNESYQQDIRNQYQTPVTTSYQNTSYISNDNQIPYSSSQWMGTDLSNQIPKSMSTAKIATDPQKTLPSSQSSTLQAGLAGAPIAAAAAAQTLGRFMASGAMKLGSLLSSAAPKPPVPTTTSMSAPVSTGVLTYSAITTVPSTFAGATRPQLKQQISITESEPYHPYAQMPQDTVPTMNYQNDQYISSDQPYGNYSNDYYKDSEIHEQLDYNVHDDRLHDLSYNSGVNQRDNIDHRYAHDGVLDEYNSNDEQGFASDHSKTQNSGSPVSVIHVGDRLEPITGSFEEDDHRMENSLVEPYRPKVMSPSVPSSRKTSVEVPYRSSPLHDASVKELQLSETIGSPPPDIRQAIHTGELETGSIIGSEEKAKSVSFEEEETSRRPAGARQRWHWAYAKILMQLNVSEILFIQSDR